MHQVMLATGVCVAFFLCLRSSEYVSKTVVPLADTHQFMSTDVQFILNDRQFTLINSNQIGNYAYDDFKTVKFSLLHGSLPCVFLLYTWSKHSLRLDADPFLSYRVRGHLFCLLYSHVQAAVKSSAAHFGLSAEWFNTHSIQLSGPTIARAANLSVPHIMRMGRWRSLPAPILYQEQSTAMYDHILSVINNPALFTTEDILLSRVLVSRTGSSSIPTLRQYNKGKR
jgi:hypothetical protein